MSRTHDQPVTSPTTRAVDATVSGRVQGVGFRYATAGRAESLGVVGWVRNEPDGSVALHAEGPAGAVDALVAWCHDGPPLARVSRVAVRAGAVTGASSFEVSY